MHFFSLVFVFDWSISVVVITFGSDHVYDRISERPEFESPMDLL